ncbi:facilitated trehalose transporter Tret1-like [Oratosquilla oratoria]|uniref:facilitated trehalose transporter Tret1-like n=1 Tax=Oratosquilla oratoria TaxID=337810 RepID=UPI003F757D56
MKLDPAKVPGFYRQLGCSMILAWTAMSLGTTTSWPTVIPKIHNDTHTDLDLTFADVQWIISLPRVTAVFVPLMTGSLMEWMGACRLITLCMIPTVVFPIILSLVPSKEMLYVLRTVLGFSNGLIITAVAPLTSELMSPEIRGIFASFRKIHASLGNLFMYISATFLSWYVATAVSAVPLIPLTMLLLLVPESPYWLARHGRIEDATRTLFFLRGQQHDVQPEIDKIREGIAKQPSATVKDQFQLLKLSKNYKPVIVMAVSAAAGLMSGQSIIFQYTVFLFEEANVDLDPFFCTILVGLVRLLASILSAVTVDMINRRPLLIISGLVCGSSLIMTSICLLVPALPRWLIVFFVLIFVVSLTLGVGLVPALVASELIPTPVRPIGVAICTNVSVLVALINTITFPNMLVGIGLENSFFIFAAFNYLLAIIFWLWVPETRGRSLVDLQDVFEKPKNQCKMENMSKRFHHQEVAVLDCRTVMALSYSSLAS